MLSFDDRLSRGRVDLGNLDQLESAQGSHLDKSSWRVLA